MEEDLEPEQHPSSRKWAFILLGAAFIVLAAFMICVAKYGHPPQDSTAFATWALAILTLVLAFGVPITIWLASKENKIASDCFLVQQKNHFNAQQNHFNAQQNHFYAQLDNIYMDIQKIIIEHPHLANPNGSRTPDKEVQYQAFAFIVWNFIESIYDYTGALKPSDSRSEQENQLLETWGCILRYEGTLHSTWFLKPENKKKFKAKFYDYMKGQLAERKTQKTAALRSANSE